MAQLLSRLQLHEILEEFGAEEVYFQPAENLSLKYPCIIYELDTADTKYADNVPYRYTKRYTITVIDEDPDSLIPDMVASLPMSRHDRWFAANNLNHNVFNVYF